MSNVDGQPFIIAGSYILLESFHNNLLSDFVLGSIVVVFMILCVVYAFFKMH